MRDKKRTPKSKYSSMSALSVGLLAIVGSTSVWGDNVWQNATTAYPTFADGKNWQSGTAPDVKTKAVADSKYYDGVAVDFSQVTLTSAAKPQTIVLPVSNNGYLLFGTITANPYQLLCVDYGRNGATVSRTDVVWVNNASNFKGLISCDPAGGSGAHNQQTFVGLFNGTTLPIADGRHGMGYYTRYSNAATIGQFAGAGVVTLGTVNYIGQGTTTFSYPSGPETSFMSRCGTSVLNGYTSEPGLVSGAVLHFDASDKSTMTVSNGKVTAWRDKSGSGIVAESHPLVSLSLPSENPGMYAPADPRLSNDASSGLPVVSFGAPYGNRTKYQDIAAARGDLGHPGALKLSAAVSGIKEVFFVFRDTIGKEYRAHVSAPFVLGTESGHAALNPFGRLITERRFTDDLFASTGASGMMTTSAVFLDGQRIIPEKDATFNDYSRQLHVVSCGLSDGTGTIESLGLGCDANGNVYYGGVMIAEVLAYDRSLSVEERHQVNAYLRQKWQPDAGRCWDYGSLWLKTSGSYSGAFQVGAGVTAIRDLRPLTATFDKEGAGTLVIGRLHGFDEYTINVKGGDVRFDMPALPVEKRAADPLVWFDATQVATDKILHQDNVDYVTEIVDPREGGKNHHDMVVKAIRHNRIVNQNDKLGAYATLEANALNGKPVFNFGDYYPNNASDGWGLDTVKTTAAPYLINLDGSVCQDNMREVFMVVRIRPETDANVVDILGGGNYEIFGGGLKYLINPQFTSGMSRSGLWRVNGEIVDPTSFARNSSDFYLVSVAFPRALTFNTFAIDRNANKAGGLDVAEVLVYDRQLTDAERVNTEAYLMKKWFDQEHPYSKPVKVRVNSATNPVRLTNGQGSLDISDVAIESLKGIEVFGGQLKWNFPGADYLFLKSKVHLDATVLTMAEGGSVTAWDDVRGNGVKATADRGGSAETENTAIIRPGVTPTLTMATIGGVVRKVVDFGDFSNGRATDSSGMRVNANGQPASSSAMRINIGNTAADKGVEFYVVHADAHTEGCTSYTGIMGIQENGAEYTVGGTKYTNTYPFLRNGRKLINSSHSQSLARGTILVDNVSSSANYEIAGDNQFHLYTFYPEVPVLARGLAMRTTYERGGQQLGEVAIFTETNTAERRAMINAHLMKKWFGQGAGFVLSLDDIVIQNDGVFDFAAADVTPIAVKSVVGDGTIKAQDLTVSNELVFDVKADAHGRGTGVTSLVVDGRLTLPQSGTIKLNLPTGLTRMVGTFPLVTATELVGNLSGLTLTCSPTGSAVSPLPKLHLQGNVLSVEFPPRGLCVILR